MKEKENNTVPTYIILELCLELRREVDTQCYRPYPSYITEADFKMVKSSRKKQRHQQGKLPIEQISHF